jgi:hypothetical protein
MSFMPVMATSSKYPFRYAHLASWTASERSGYAPRLHRARRHHRRTRRWPRKGLHWTFVNEADLEAMARVRKPSIPTDASIPQNCSQHPLVAGRCAGNQPIFRRGCGFKIRPRVSGLGFRTRDSGSKTRNWKMTTIGSP